MSRRLGDDGTSTVSAPTAAAAPPPAPQHLPRESAPRMRRVVGSRGGHVIARRACGLRSGSKSPSRPAPPRPPRPQAPEADAAARPVSLVNSSQNVRVVRSFHTPDLKHSQRSALPLPPKERNCFSFGANLMFPNNCSGFTPLPKNGQKLRLTTPVAPPV